MRFVLAVLALVASVTVAPSSAGSYSPPPPVVWSSLFPGVPTLANPQFTGVVGCETPRMACIDREIAQLDAVRVRFGCDHRGVFATTYELLTIVLRNAMRSNPHLFDDPAWVIGEDVTFANLYFRAVDDYQRGRPVAPAWKVAFDTAARGDANAVQDMLLGINAHVQRDMPFMLAAVGLHTPSGASRKHDHDALNFVLNDAYQRVTDTIAQRFDPAENFIAPGANLLLGTIGNLAGAQLVEIWREIVWRNAENLLNAHDGVALRNTKNGIEGTAVTWANGIALIQLPGYRASRDAYCAAHNIGPLVLAKR